MIFSHIKIYIRMIFVFEIKYILFVYKYPYLCGFWVIIGYARDSSPQPMGEQLLMSQSGGYERVCTREIYHSDSDSDSESD